jgi:hypothetical protein
LLALSGYGVVAGQAGVGNNRLYLALSSGNCMASYWGFCAYAFVALRLLRLTRLAAAMGRDAGIGGLMRDFLFGLLLILFVC